MRGHPAEKSEKNERGSRDEGAQMHRWCDGQDEQGHRGANGERCGRRERGLQGTCGDGLRNAELIPRVGGECVSRHQLFGNQFSEGRIEPAPDVDPCELLVLAKAVCLELL